MAFPGPRWNSDQIAQGLLRAGFRGWELRTGGAMIMAESLGYVWSHAINHDGSGTPPTSVAYLAEGYGLGGMDGYWLMRVWRPGDTTRGGLLMAPYWAGQRTMSQLGMDPEWNLAMTKQVFDLNVIAHGYVNAWKEGWTSVKNDRHLPFMLESYKAAVRAGAI